MARNEEKSHSMLNRYLESQKQEKYGGMGSRPPHTSMETSVQAALKWRMEIVREASKLISEIQASGLDEHRARELNDEINSKQRLKRAWEHRLVELGGPNYLSVHPTQFSDIGIAPQGGKGAYRYYGVAKNLPGVKELLETDVVKKRPRHKSAAELKSLDTVYFGFVDEQDEELLREEERAEKRARDEEQPAEPETHQQVDPILEVLDSSQVPTASEIEQLIVERKKKEILAQFS